MDEETGKDIRLTEFDCLLADPHLQMIKAALPYMRLPQQRMLSLFIKLQELNRTRQLFRSGEMSAMGLGTGTEPSSPVEMLQAIKPYASPREQDVIETIENLQIMLQAMRQDPA